MNIFKQIPDPKLIACLAMIAALCGCDAKKASEESTKEGARLITLGFFPDEENFGVVRFSRTSMPRSITLQNVSRDNFFISSIVVNSPDGEFKMDSNNCPGTTSPLTPSQGCEIDLIFKPSTYGPRSATIIATFGSNIGGTEYQAKGELIGAGGSSLLFPGVDSITDVGGTEATINWTHVVGAQKYIVYLVGGNTEQELATVDAPTKSYRVSGLSLNTKYTFRVRLIDSYGYVDDNTRDRTITTLASIKPSFLSVSQNGGPLSGGTTLTITGNNFQPGVKVKIGTIACNSVTYVSSTTITCVTPPSISYTGEISIENPDQQKATGSTFTFQNPPTISAVSPSSGPWNGGTTITLTGTGFLAGATVTLNGDTCDAPTVVSSTSMTCVTRGLGAPTGGSLANIVVTNTDTQQGTKTNAYSFSFADSSLVAGAQYPFGCQAGDAETARFRTPVGLYVDGSNLFFSGYNDYAIWKTDLTTAVTSVFSGKPCIAGTLDGPAADATWTNAFGIVKIGSDYYVSQQGRHDIRKIDGSNGQVSNVAGLSGTANNTNGIGTAARFNQPRGLATDGTYIYVADMNNHRIRRVDPSDGSVTTIAGSSSGFQDHAVGTSARFNSPRDLTFYNGSLYVADYSNHRVRRIDLSDNSVTTFSGQGTAGYINGPSGSARFNSPNTITNDGTNLYVGEIVDIIRRVSLADGSVSLLAGAYNTPNVINDAVGSNARFYDPQSIATDGTYVYVADASETIRRISIATTEVSTFAGLYQSPYYVTFTDGATARFNQPLGVTTVGDTLYVADTGNNRIRQVDLNTGVTSTLAGSGGAGNSNLIGPAATFNQPREVVACGNTLYVSDYNGHVIRSIDISSAQVNTIAGGYGAAAFVDDTGTAARFSFPNGMVADATCSNLYIADRNNHRIRKLDLGSGAVTTLAGSGANSTIDGVGTAATLTFPAKLARIGTDLYFTSDGDHKIRKIDLNTSTVTSLNLNVASFFDASDISSARFYSPRGLATDGTRLYIMDYTNHAVRLYQPSTGAVTSITANQSPTNLTHNSFHPYGEFFGDLSSTTKMAYPYSATYHPTEGLIIGTGFYGIVRLR